MTDHNQERAQFEAAYKAACLARPVPRFDDAVFAKDHCGDYISVELQNAWWAWNTRAQLQPASVAVPDKQSGAVGFAKGLQDGWNAAIDTVLKLNAAPHPVSGEQKQADGWISPTDRLPDVPAGDDLDVLVAVRRAHNGKVYVFTTSYLTRYPVLDHDQFIQDDDNDHREITGWFYLSDDEETWHRTLCKGDELVAWQLKPAAPGEVAAHRAQAHGGDD